MRTVINWTFSMIRFVLRLGFWSALALLAMPSSRTQVMNHGFAPQSLASAFGFAMQDAGNFCAQNLTFCDSATHVGTEIALLAKQQMLDAYHGIRAQHDNTDHEVMTGSIRKQAEQP